MTATSDGLVRLEGIAATAVESGALYSATLPNGNRVCIGRHADGLSFFAVKDSCPHREYPLSEGTLYANGEIECCWHGARFDCRTGAVLQGPAESELVRYEVEERDGALWVRSAPIPPVKR